MQEPTCRGPFVIFMTPSSRGYDFFLSTIKNKLKMIKKDCPNLYIQRKDMGRDRG